MTMKDEQMKTDVTVGVDAGKKLLSFVASASRRLVVVSPWLSPATADLLVKKQGENVDVTVVTSNDPRDKTHQLALARLVRSKRQRIHPRQWLALLPGVPMILGGIYLVLRALLAQPLLMDIFIGGLVSAAAGAVLCWVGSRAKTYFFSTVGTLAVMPPEPLPHAKVYVVDDDVAVSSANFTVSGVQHNLEGVAFLYGQNAVASVIQQINEMTSGKAAVLKIESKPPRTPTD